MPSGRQGGYAAKLGEGSFHFAGRWEGIRTKERRSVGHPQVEIKQEEERARR